MTTTHTFKMPTGVLCEVKEFTGDQQEILTSSDKKSHTEKLNQVLKSIIVRIGSVSTIDDKFLEQLLECDKRHILVEARQFTMDFDPDFTFVYKYTDTEGKKAEHEFKEKIPEGHFPMRPMQVVNPAYDENTLGTDEETPKLIDAEYAEYSDVEREHYCTLPKCGELIRFIHLDGKGTSILQATDKKNRNSSTPILMRNPVYFKQGDNTKVPIQLNLKRLHLKDIEFLRKEIKLVEGSVDTEISFEHPEAENRPAGERDVVLDVLGTVAFFFPSEAI